MTRGLGWLLTRTLGLAVAAVGVTVVGPPKADACFSGCNCQYDGQTKTTNCACVSPGPGLVNCTASSGTNPSCSMSGSSC